MIINYFSRRARCDYKNLFGHAVFRAPNPPCGISINYHLKQDMDPPVTILIHNQAGELARELEGSGVKGLQRVVWNLRPGYLALHPLVKPEMVTSPSVIPGAFTITVQAGEWTSVKEVSVLMKDVIQAALGA